MSNVRVTYSGLIALAVGLVSVFTGIIFTMIVTRRLTPEDFGLWSLVGTMIGYYLIIEPIVSYWSTREIARGKEVGKTSIFSSLTFSIAVIPVYIILAISVSKNTQVDLNILLIGVLLLPLMFISQTLLSINLAHKPQATSYGIIGFEIIKIPIALLLVFYLDWSVIGAILSTIVAYLVKISIQLYFAKSKLKGPFIVNTLRRWLKIAWIPLYSSIPHLIWTVDLLVYTLIIGSTIGLAYYSASLAVAGIISHSGLISQALYPKLLANGTKDHIRENFSHVLFFAIPLFGITIIFAKPALFALNPQYAVASIVVMFIAIRGFFFVLTNMLYKVLRGMEQVDVKENPKFNQLIKSKLFFVPSLEIIHHSLYIISVAVMLLILDSLEFSEIELVTFWSMIMVILQIPLFIYVWYKVQKSIKIELPSIQILKYVFATVAFVIIFQFSADYIITYDESIYKHLPSLIIALSVCIGIYVSITYAIDKKTRHLIQSIINELKKTK